MCWCLHINDLWRCRCIYVMWKHWYILFQKYLFPVVTGFYIILYLLTTKGKEWWYLLDYYIAWTMRQNGLNRRIIEGGAIFFIDWVFEKYQWCLIFWYHKCHLQGIEFHIFECYRFNVRYAKEERYGSFQLHLRLFAWQS